MALAKFPGASVEGIGAFPVTVEVDVASGLPGFTIVGLADRAVEESRERVRSAIKHSGFSFPLARLTIHLAPSEKQKSGVHFDLPIALGVLLADEQIHQQSAFGDTMFIGGLSLDGSLQAVTGALILAEYARDKGFTRLVLPAGNLEEAQLVPGIDLLPFSNLSQIIEWLDRGSLPATINQPQTKKLENFDNDWLQIQGQQQAKRAALIAAAGGHNLLLEGPPGAGKTLLAKGLRALLPPLEREELIEVLKIYSISHLLPKDIALKSIGRPFRSPHHTASDIALIGGGSKAKPGEISLAHRGILFLDELPEFHRSVIEALRQPLEEGVIHVSRIHHSITYPANFMLIATMNPCPCGWLGSNQKECSCSAHQIAQYRKRVSGPILDRIDLYLRVPAVALRELQSSEHNHAELEEYQSTIARSRTRQKKRNNNKVNADISSGQVADICVLDDGAQKLIEQANQKFVLTGRSYHKILKVARTIADINGHQAISGSDIAEALQYRFSES